MSDDRLFVGRPIYRPRKSRSSDIGFRPTFVQLTRWVVGHFWTVVYSNVSARVSILVCCYFAATNFVHRTAIDAVTVHVSLVSELYEAG